MIYTPTLLLILGVIIALIVVILIVVGIMRRRSNTIHFETPEEPRELTREEKSGNYQVSQDFIFGAGTGAATAAAGGVAAQFAPKKSAPVPAEQPVAESVDEIATVVDTGEDVATADAIDAAQTPVESTPAVDDAAPVTSGTAEAAPQLVEDHAAAEEAAAVDEPAAATDAETEAAAPAADEEAELAAAEAVATEDAQEPVSAAADALDAPAEEALQEPLYEDSTAPETDTVVSGTAAAAPQLVEDHAVEVDEDHANDVDAAVETPAEPEAVAEAHAEPVAPVTDVAEDTVTDVAAEDNAEDAAESTPEVPAQPVGEAPDLEALNEDEVAEAIDSAAEVSTPAPADAPEAEPVETVTAQDALVAEDVSDDANSAASDSDVADVVDEDTFEAREDQVAAATDEAEAAVADAVAEEAVEEDTAAIEGAIAGGAAVGGAAAAVEAARDAAPAESTAAAPAPAPTVPVADIAPTEGRLDRLRGRLARSQSMLGEGLLGIMGAGDLDEDAWEEIEDTLIMADLGSAVTMQVVDTLRERIASRNVKTEAEVRALLREVLIEQARPEMDRTIHALPHDGIPAVVVVVGVNGTGKTTTTGKLARVLVATGHKVVLGAADTFRAAAADQLETWGSQVGAVTVRGAEGADPAAVAFDAVDRGMNDGADVVLIDTAGRLHTKTGLMDQLGKVKRVVEKRAAVDEVLLVLDATVGQNGLMQARVFAEVVNITGVVLTKLDGTAKGGIVFQVQHELGVPVKLVGLGEGADHLAPFVAESFVDALLGPAK